MFRPDSARLRSHAFTEIPRTWTRTRTGPGNNREKNIKMIDGIYDVAFRCIRDDGAADEHHADVWLRAHHDTDPNHALSRREIVDKLQNEPEAWDSFDNGLSLNGDIIVLACLPDDMLGDVFTQVVSAHRLYLTVAYPEGLCLRRMHTNEATDRTPESEINIASLNLGAGSTVDDFIQATSADHNHNATREEYLVA